MHMKTEHMCAIPNEYGPYFLSVQSAYAQTLFMQRITFSQRKICINFQNYVSFFRSFQDTVCIIVSFILLFPT